MFEGKLVFVNKHVTFPLIYTLTSTILLKVLIFFISNLNYTSINNFERGLQKYTILSYTVGSPSQTVTGTKKFI